MRVRIRFGTGVKIGRKPRQHPSIALGIGALLTPAAVATSLLGFWGIAADLKWTSNFAISSGFFSHWQVWLLGGALLQMAALLLRHYAGPVDLPEEVPDDRPLEPEHSHSRAL
jgi:hypothetical protein